MPRFLMTEPLVDAIDLTPLTLCELSAIAGIHPSNISRYKGGTHFGKRARIGVVRLAEALGVDPSLAVVRGGR